MKKIKIIGVIVLMVAIAFIGVLVFMKLEADQVNNSQPQSQSN